jgi:hypothetical protein
MLSDMIKIRIHNHVRADRKEYVMTLLYGPIWIVSDSPHTRARFFALCRESEPSGPRKRV